jgi:hypothetical protein
VLTSRGGAPGALAAGGHAGFWLFWRFRLLGRRRRLNSYLHGHISDDPPVVAYPQLDPEAISSVTGVRNPGKVYPYASEQMAGEIDLVLALQ